SDEFVLESPRPVVAYMSRNFFSRGVLNEHDILRYILAKYNVTLRVTTFERWDYAFFRRIDFNKRVKMEYVLHPDPNGPHPEDGWPGNPWIYQNTYVDMEHFGPYIDTAMAAAGIKPVDKPIPVSLN
ncbi:expressed protein, partial [Chlorella variabilis]